MTVAPWPKLEPENKGMDHLMVLTKTMRPSKAKGNPAKTTYTAFFLLHACATCAAADISVCWSEDAALTETIM